MAAQADIDARRADATARLDTLRQEAGAALLDGRAFDASALTSAEAELEIISAAEGEVARRRRDEEAEAEAARKAGLYARLGQLETDRLAAVAKAEEGARAMVDAIREILRLADEERTAMNQIPVRPEHGLMAHSLAERLSYRLSTLLLKVDRPYQFGAMRLQPGPFPKDMSWVEAEAKAAGLIDYSEEEDAA